ncbi:MAG: ferredoxin [Achromobacter sp.]|uniref:2Fe-2S iron-sulfur cluster-binding protein n=1 Tax=Achromobacter sp. TaxID=134375 RepID=UPI002589A39D|nr:ferredoxin [Achromobacter sp.]MCW0205762.1 ferredoxin [Achromobacter sp.]
MSASFPVLVRPAGLRFDAPACTSVLLAAKAAGVRRPSSGPHGTSRAGMCQMLEGAVVYGIERPGLSPDEKEEGWILPCVAQAASALEIQAPLAAPIEPAPPPAPRPLTGARR